MKFAIFILILLHNFLILFNANSEIISEITVKGETEEAVIAKLPKVAIQETVRTYYPYIINGQKYKKRLEDILNNKENYLTIDIIDKGLELEDYLYFVKAKITIDDIELRKAFETDYNSTKLPTSNIESIKTGSLINDHLNYKTVSFVILYKKSNKFDLPYNSDAVQTVISLINDELTDNNFQVKIDEEVKRIQEILIDNNSVNEIVANKIGVMELADIVILVSFDADPNPPTTVDGYKILTATIKLNAYYASTGVHLAFANMYGKTITGTSEYDFEKGLAIIAQKAGPSATNKFIKKIKKRTIPGQIVSLIFKQISMEDFTKVEECIDKHGWQYKLLRHDQHDTELEVYTDLGVTSIRKLLQKAFNEQNLNIYPVEIDFSRIVFELRI